MAIYRGTGGSIVGVDQADEFIIAVGQGGTGADNATDARTNLGLGSAATKDQTFFATFAQGALADSAVQPADLGATATSNSYNDLDDLPTLGTAAATNSTAYATAAQGVLADSAVQPEDLATVATTGAYNDLTGKPTLATVATSGSYNDLSNKPTIPTNLDSLTDVVITSATTNQLLKFDGTNWVNATVDGSGTVTSVAMSVPTGLAVSGSPITSSGTFAVTYDTGYAIPTTAKQTEWDTAYTDRNKWDGGSTGLNATTGRTSLGLGTAATTASTDYATAAQGTKADTAYGWGNHAVAGYAADSAVVHNTGNETIAGVKTFSSTITGSISGNAGTVTNGVYTTGSYADPSWLTSLAGSKLTGTIDGGTY